VSAVAHFFRRYRLAVIVLLILGIYAFEAHARRQFNPSPASQGDQSAYLAYAQLMHDSGYSFVGERNRMPVFTFLLSLIYRPGMTETQFLERAQAFNVNLSILLLFLLFLVFRKLFPPIYAVALLVITAFGVFLYRAPLVQTEVLFYGVSFGAFLLLARMLIAPRWWLAVVSGIVIGLAHLTKASVLPGLALWAVLFVAQSFWPRRTSDESQPRKLWQRFGMLLLVFGTFLGVIFPYVRTSKQLYGQYFYNVNSTFVLWCDSSEEGWVFLSALQEKGSLREFPPDQIPSAAKYWREHSVSQIVQRLAHGVGRLATQKAMWTSYYKFFVAFFLTAAILVARQPRRLVRLIGEKPFAAAFCFLFCLLYLLLFAWYEKIITDTRFILSIFLPFIFSASVLVLGLAQDRSLRLGTWRLPFAQLFAGILMALALIDAGYNAYRAFRG